MPNLFSYFQMKNLFSSRAKISSIKYYHVIYSVLLFVFLMAIRANSESDIVTIESDKESIRYQVAKFNFVEVSDVYAITLWILLGSLAKIGTIFFFY